MDDLVISEGYHFEPILIHGILDSGAEGAVLRDQLIAWDFAYHPFLNPDPDLEEDPHVVNYDGLPDFEPEEDEAISSRPWGPLCLVISSN